MMTDMIEDKRIVVAWNDPYSVRDKYGSDSSSDDFKLRTVHATITYDTEEPAFARWSGATAIPLRYLRKASPTQMARYFKLQKSLKILQDALKACEADVALTGDPITWDWILANGRQSETKPNEKGETYVPVPYHSKLRLANLRRGSRVVISVVGSRYAEYGILGKIGKIVKKRDKNVIVRFGKSDYRIPYRDLKPANESSTEQRKDAVKEGELAKKLGREMNRVFGGAF